MTPILQELIDHLALERLEEDLFRGPSRDIGTNQVYGGQVLGQALKAAQYTVGSERRIHSLHAYFLRRGDFNAPIIYEVDRSRDGGSFSARRVVAIQHGRQIFTLSASFQHDEPGLDFHAQGPEVQPPESLPGLEAYRPKELTHLPSKLKRLSDLSAPFDIRYAEDPFRSRGNASKHYCWIRTVDRLPDDDGLHRAILAYVSDYGLLPTVLRPHGVSAFDESLVMASIDHAMWFHRPFRMDEWLLCVFEAISTSNARGLARGSIYRADGVLVASTAQEGLIRLKR
jgi:acyl-CoA thioesterase-2